MALDGVTGLLREALVYFESSSSPFDVGGDSVSSRLEAAVASLTAAEWEAAPLEAQAGVFRQLAALGGALAALTDLLAPVYSGNRWNPDSWRQAEGQLLAACNTLAACSALATIAGGIPGCDSYRFCRAAQLLLDVGRKSIGRFLQTASEANMPTLGRPLDQSGAPWVLELLMPGRVLPQLRALQSLLAYLAIPGQERTLTAFAATVATPPELLRWLGAVCMAVKLGFQLGVEVEPLLPALVGVCDVVISNAAFSKHRELLGSDAAMQQAQLAMLVPHMLAAVLARLRGSGSSSGSGGRLAPAEWVFVRQVLRFAGDSCLSDSLQELMLPDGRPDDPSCMLAMADVFCLLPRQRSHTVLAADAQCCLLMEAVIALGQVAYILTPDEGKEMRPAHRQAAWRMLQCLPALAQAAQQLHFDLAAELAQQPLAARRLLQDSLYDCTCLAAENAQALPVPGDAAVGATEAAAQCGGPVEWAHTLGRAAQAALQLLQCAAEQPGPWLESQGSWLESQGRGLLARHCLDVIRNCQEPITVLRQHFVAAPLSPAQQQQLWQQVRQPHAAACRLVHYAAAASEAQRAAIPALSDWNRLASCLDSTFLEDTSNLEVMSQKELSSASAAHIVAVIAAVTGLSGNYSDSKPKNLLACLSSLVSSLSVALVLCESWLGSSAAARQMLSTCLSKALKVAGGDASHALSCATCLACAATEVPLLAAVLVSSGALTELVEAAALVPSEGPDTWDQEATQFEANILRGCLPDVLNLMKTLTTNLAAAGAAAGSSSVRSIGSSSEGSSVAARVLLRRQQPSSTVVFTPRDELLAAYKQQFLPAATPLAAALEAHLSQREQQAAARLELARVAATRSCAFLGCANLRASGGPDAGQGEGSLKCAACRAVWYCGTACSHADWRAGHKRVCKALAAERAARRTAEQA